MNFKSKARQFCFVLTVLLVVSGFTGLVQAQVTLDNSKAKALGIKNPKMFKMKSDLIEACNLLKSNRISLNELKQNQLYESMRGGKLQAIIACSNLTEAESIIEKQGLEVLHILDDFGLKNITVRCNSPLELEKLVEYDAIIGITPEPAVASDAGSVPAQADIALNALNARTNHNVDGSNIRVGVLSDSIADLRLGAGSISGTPQMMTGTTDQVSGDLPDPMRIIDPGPNFTNPANNNTDEGNAMCQLIYDIAPDCEISFASAFTSYNAFATNITALHTDATHPADIIVDDVTYFTEPIYQDGPIALAYEAAFTAGVPCFASAGNRANQSHVGGYSDINAGTDNTANPPTGVDLHNYGGGDTHLDINVTAGTRYQIVLHWNQPYSTANGLGAGPGSQADLDVYVVTTTTLPLTNAMIEASSRDMQGTAGSPSGDAVEFLSFTPTTSGRRYIVVDHFNGIDPSQIRLLIIRGIQIVDAALTGGTSLNGHAGAKNVMAIAAVDFCDIESGGVIGPDFNVIDPETFSSDGGNLQFFFDGAGNPQVNDIRFKPDFAAPDGLNTTFFGSNSPAYGGICGEPDAFRNFYGTSAAAPNAAACAALLLEQAVNTTGNKATPQQVYDALRNTAIDVVSVTQRAPIGRDIRTGDGYIDINAALTTPSIGLLASDFISLPIDGQRSPGRFVAPNTSQGGKYNPDGTGGGSGTDFWIEGVPVHNYTLYANGSLVFRNGIAPNGQRATTRFEKDGDLNKAFIDMAPVNGIEFKREVSFRDSEQIVTITDTVGNNTPNALLSSWSMDTIDPDQGVADGLGCATYNDVQSVGTSAPASKPDIVTASMPLDGLTMGFGSEDPSASVSAEGFPNDPLFNPSQVLFSPQDPNDLPDDICINIANSFGTLAAGTSGTFTWYMFFGPSKEAAIDQYLTKVNDGAVGVVPNQVISFGNQDVTAGVTTQTFQIGNAGNEPLRFKGPGLTITGRNASDFLLPNANLLPIAPGTTRTFSVTFDPTVAGDKEAQINVLSGLSSSPFIQIDLLGTGISTGALAVTEPNGQNVFGQGQMMKISWIPDAATVGANVGLRLREGGTTITQIAASTPNDGDFDFMIPATQAVSTNYRVDVTVANSNSILDFSNTSFQIQSNPSLSITSPTMTTVLTETDVTTITWNNNNIAGSPFTSVDIQLFKGGELFRDIAPRQPNFGSFRWNLNTLGFLPSGSDYQVRIRITATPEIVAISDQFTILPLPEIVITAPCNDAAVVQGGTEIISWFSYGDVSDTVDINLYRNGNFLQPLATNVPTTTGLFTWNVPADLTLGPSYSIQVEDSNDPIIFNFSSLFSVVPQNDIQVASPNGGETFVRGATYRINWQNFVNASQRVIIELLKGGAVDTVLSNDWPVVVPFRWTVPLTQAEGDDYRIRVTLVSDPTTTDESDMDFEIGDPRPWYFAEGSTANSDSTFLLLVNPNGSDAEVEVTFYPEGGTPSSVNQTVQANSRATINVSNVLGAGFSFGMRVRSLNGIEVYAERAMYWNPGGFFRGAGTASVPSFALDTEWFLSEGTTTGDRETFIPILNPNANAANIEITFLRQGDTPVVVPFVLAGNQRATVISSQVVPSTNFSTRVESTNGVPVVVERTMRGQALRPGINVPEMWGHSALGVNNPSTIWNFAEGAVHSFFETFLTLGNNTNSAANVSIDFLLSDGSTVNHVVMVPGNERFTLNVEADVPGMTDQAGFSIVANSTNGVPIIAERAMYFTVGDFINRSGGHAVVGIPEAKERWFLAEGAVGGASGFETFVLLGSSASASGPATVNVRLIRAGGAAPVVIGPLQVNPGQRVTVNATTELGALPGSGTQSFSIEVESTNGVPVFAERAMYFASGGFARLGGHASSGFFVP